MSKEFARKIAVRAISVILRVPGLFIAEAWYRTDPLTIQNQYNSIAKGKVEQPHEIVFYVLYYIAIILSISLIILPLKKLVNLYMYLVSGLLIAVAHYLSSQFVNSEKTAPQDASIFEDEVRMQRLGLYFIAQGVISATIAYLINLHNMMKVMLLLLHTAPMLARVAMVPSDDLNRVHNFSTFLAILVVVCFTFNNIPIILDLAKDTVRQMSVAVQLYGWIPFLMAVWLRILLPVQFLTFWCVLFVLQLYKYLSVANHPIMAEGWMVVMLASIGESCVTPMSLLGLCITVSYVSYIVLSFTKLYLQGRNAFLQDTIMHQGWTEGFTMFLLAIQTGIIELKSPQRAFLMSIVLFIVVSSLIQSMFEITDPILLALGASQNKNVFKHLRAISLCTFLWMAPLYMTFIICQFFDLDFWLMVVISSCILTSVQVVGSLVVYSLFILDSCRSHPWENIDDVVYYAKATTRVLEFIVALFVVCYGTNEALFGEWSFVNTSILIVHCYFNVWQRLQAGWKAYLLRREAAKKIDSLPDATPHQLETLNDVCPICYQDLQTAKITPCKHFFHGPCLRKWLYVQEYCPMCHENLTKNQNSEEIPEVNDGAEQNEADLNANVDHNGESDSNIRECESNSQSNGSSFPNSADSKKSNITDNPLVESDGSKTENTTLHSCGDSNPVCHGCTSQSSTHSSAGSAKLCAKCDTTSTETEMNLSGADQNQSFHSSGS